MSCAVLISIRPKWCEMIALGKKTIEVRKTAPKLETPFKCYIYCARGSYDGNPDRYFWTTDSAGFHWLGNGRIVGEFVCDKGYKFSTRVYLGEEQEIPDEEIVKKSCVSRPELRAYEGRRQGIFGWHISDLMIYDQPKELSEFRGICSKVYCQDTCDKFKKHICSPSNGGKYMITRPPQSWCYVEELQ